MRKIILLCTAGMSTGALVTKMKVAAKESGYESEIAAYSVSEAASVAVNADIILLGPQVKYQLKSVQKLFPEKPVEAIDMVSYGRMDGAKVIAYVKEVLGD